jgi:primase-polymerase (primpol)-like protein
MADQKLEIWTSKQLESPPETAQARPTALKPCFEKIPSELRALPNWVMWRYEPPNRPDNSKWRKVPCNLNGKRTDAANRTSDWTTFGACRDAYLHGIAGTGPRFDGVGFCFDGVIGPDGYCYTGIDFDDLCDGNTISLKQRARIKRLATYTERSVGGQGIHCICRSKPHTLKKNKNGVEIYSRARYFTFTGHSLGTIRAADAEVTALIAEVQAEQGVSKASNGQQLLRIEVAKKFQHLPVRHDLNDGIEEHWFDRLQPLQKDEVIDHALAMIASKTALLELREDGGDNDQWYRLTTAVARSGAPNAEEIFVKYALTAQHPDPEDKLRDHFIRCQKAPPRGLDDVSVGTLLWLAQEHGADFEPWRNSAAEQERRAKQIAENIKIGDDVTEPLLPQVMTLEQMCQRLVFIGSIGGVADLETGRVRKKDHATEEYAASMHTVIQDNGKPKKVPALKLWIASRSRTTVEVLAWVPGKPQICQPPEGPGPAFNTWRGLSSMAYPENWQEWIQPFLEHVEFLVPIAEERERFLQWLAHIVQHPEVLPHTNGQTG